jgi:hypothetical protein
MAGVTQRAASLEDIKGVWDLMRQVATDIPFDLTSEVVQENILTEVMACCTSGLSPIYLGADKSIVGALLVRRDDFEWGFINGPALHMAYAPIVAEQRDKGVLQALMADVQGHKVPVFASVKSDDKLGLAEELVKLGFAHECTAASGWGNLYKWEPAPAATP